MRPHFLTPALLLLAACRDTLPERLPPSTSFAYPSALVHVPSATGGAGTLYVASSNFDKLFDSGAVMAVDLDSVGQGAVLDKPLPPFPTDPAQPPPEMVEIGLNVPAPSTVYVQSMAGDMALHRAEQTGATYLFVPSRAEGDYLHVVQADGAALSCAGTGSRKCYERAVSLTEASDHVNGLPGAPGPLGVTIGAHPETGAPEVWVTHVTSALIRKGDNRQETASTYVVRADVQGILNALGDSNVRAPLQLPASDFIRLNSGANLAGAHAVALGTDFAFLSGRVVTSGQGTGGVPPFLLRAISLRDEALFTDPNLRVSYPNIEARGLAFNESGTRLYMAARAAGSTLLVMNVTSSPDALGVSLVRALDTLPPGASTVKVLSRGPGRGDLVLISCSTAGVLAIYDDEVGGIVAQVPDLGSQPYAIAVEPRAPGARVFVGNFGDGQLNVIDIRDLDSPQEARLVAKLGGLQRCAPGDTDDSCPEGAL